MDIKKVVKDYIINIVDWVAGDYSINGHTTFSFKTYGDMWYLIADKALDKRIKKWLKKRYGIEAEVYYDALPSPHRLSPQGEIRVGIIKNYTGGCLYDAVSRGDLQGERISAGILCDKMRRRL